MTLKEKIKSYSFWVSLASAIVLILKVIGAKFGFNIDATLASDIITSVCSVLVITGIIVTPTSKANSDLELFNSKTSQNSIKENLSILSNNLKETADEILNGTTQNTEDEKSLLDQTTEKIGEPITVADKPTTTEAVEETKEIESKSIGSETEIKPAATVNENLIEPVEPIEEPAEVQSITKTIPTETELKSVLASQKDIWAKNIDVYYQILLEEVKSLKPNE